MKLYCIHFYLRNWLALVQIIYHFFPTAIHENYNFLVMHDFR